jgi:hypothetical protein
MKFLLLIFLLGCSHMTYRRTCPTYASREPDLGISDLTSYLQENRIELVNNPTYDDVKVFLFYYQKIPLQIRQQMIKGGSTIHLINGSSVLDDPTWNTNSVGYKDDWRSFKAVHGTGGMPYIHRPTRIVVNELESRSKEMPVHELGHAFDNLYKFGGISSSSEWQKVYHSKNMKGLLDALCVGSYCEKGPEAFAEAFAYYHACPATRKHMEEQAPEAAKFFSGLK